jgi:hypothetical protein
MLVEQEHAEPSSQPERSTHSVRPTIAREGKIADQLLSAFADARSLSIRAREDKYRSMAAELDRFAWSIVRNAEPVRVHYAQSRLDISNPTVRTWLTRGILQGVGRSPQRVTLESVAAAEELARELRRNGQHRDLTAAIERRVQWDRLRQSPDFKQGLQRIQQARHGTVRDHRTAEQRSLAFHRRVARELDQASLAAARQRVDRWLRQKGPVPPIWAEQWKSLLARPVADIKKAIVKDSEPMRELRQNTPFAGALPEPERMRLVSETH